jgi:arginyl-tRNA synthetase
MNIQNTIEIAVKKAIKDIFDAEVNSVEFQATRKDFEGDITIVIYAP